MGVDKILKKAYNDRNDRIVLFGLSAGAICWFKYRYSDSMSFYNSRDWEYIRVECLGFVVNAVFCLHFNGSTEGKIRMERFINFMKKYSEMGI